MTHLQSIGTKRSFLFFVGALMVIGILLRFQSLTIPDLTTDEAQYSLPGTAAHPPLGIALYQSAMQILGRDLLVFRSVAAVMGTLTLLLVYSLTKILVGRGDHVMLSGVEARTMTQSSAALVSARDDTAPLLATALAALFPPHILYSRLGYLDVIQCAAWLALLLCFLKAHRFESGQKGEPHSLLGKVLTRFHRNVASEHQTMLWLTLTFVASVASTMIKGQGLVFPVLLLLGLFVGQGRKIIHHTNTLVNGWRFFYFSPLPWTLILSLIPIGFYFLAHPEILATVLLYTGGEQGGMYGASNPLGRILELVTTWWRLFPLTLLLLFASLFSREVWKLPWALYVLCGLFILIPFILGPDHPYYTVYFVLPTSLFIALALSTQRSLVHVGILSATLVMALLTFPPAEILRTRFMEPSYREAGYYNAHAEKMNTILKGEKKVTVLGYPGHAIRWYLEPEVLVGRRMTPPYPTRFVLVLQEPEKALEIGGVLYEDEKVTIVKQDF